MFSRRLSRQLRASLGITRASRLFQVTRHEDVEKKDDMLQSCWQRQGWQVGVVIAFGISGAIGMPCDRTLAQLTPDTAPERNLGTVVSPLNPQIDLITGGTRPQNGSNIFHSFSQFNIDEGRGVYFDNPDGVINIFSRVTGNNASSIFGVLGVGQPDAVGTANLFLINPNGIIFGQGAQLNLGGSFVGTTANAIQFPGGAEFSVNSPVDSGNPLLTVNPSAFFFNQLANQQTRSIEVRKGAVLSVGFSNLGNPGNLLLVGGDVVIEGSGGSIPNNLGNLQGAPGSDIQVGGFKAGSVGLIFDTDNKLRLELPETSLPTGVVGANVSLINGAGINLGTETDDAGNIRLTGATVSLTGGSFLSSSTFGAGNAGSITLQAEKITIDGSSAIFSTAEPGSSGDAGNIAIEAGSFSLKNNSRLETDNYGSFSLSNGSRLETLVRSGGKGNAGFIDVQATGSVSISDSTYNVDISTRINSSVELGSQGNAGAIYISAGSFELKSAFLTTSTSAEEDVFGQPSRAGAINLYIDGAATLRDSVIFNNLESGAIGEGGGISIAARSLSLLGGSQIQALVRGPDENGNPGAQGSGGSITINVPDFVNISGQGPDPYDPGQLFSSGLFVNTTQGAIGPAGSITVNTNNLSITNSGFITAETENGSDAGRITLNVNTLEVDNGKISSESSSTGNAGDIVLNVNDRLTVQNKGEISVAGTGTGNPGNLDVTAGYIYLSEGGKLGATSASGRNANINVQVRDSIQMRYNSEISAEAFNNGDGGNITINAGNIIFAFLQENSDIVANAFEGKGGNVYAKAQGVFGFRQSGQVRTPESEFIASSELGIDGTTEIDSQDKLDESVPINFVDATGLIDRRCTPRNNPQERSSFTITGRGGLPPNPNDMLQNDSVEANWVTIEPPKENRTGDDASINSDESVPSATRVPKTSQFVEAQGWVYGANGEIILTASAPTVIPHSPSVVPDECQGFERSQL